MNKKYVWYACYGSNLLKERFMHYIKGGNCRFNGRTYMGCRDKSDPIEDRQISIPYELYFGNSSSGWEDGGVAFLKPIKDDSTATLGRMYMICEEQFEDVQEQEGKDWYGKALCLGEYNGMKIMTFTHESEFFRKRPGEKYKKVIEEGLKETYPEMSQNEIDKYIDICIMN